MNKKSLLTFFMLFSVVLSIGSLSCEEINKESAFGEDITVENTIKLPEWAQKQKEKAVLFCKKHKKALKIIAGSLVALGGSFGFYHLYSMIYAPVVPNPSPNPVPGGAPSLSISSSSSSSSAEDDGNTGLQLEGGPSTNNVDNKGLESKESEDGEDIFLSFSDSEEKEEEERRQNADGKKRDKEENKGPKKEFFETEYTQWALDNQKNLNFSFKQLPILSQFESNGGSASCGYHALLRGIELVRILNNGYEQKNYDVLTDPGIIDKYCYKKTFWEKFENLYTWLNNGTKPKNTGLWRQKIIDTRAGKKSSNDSGGDWLDDDELRLLWQEGKRFVSEMPCECVVIPNFSVIGHPVEGVDDVTDMIKDILAHNAQTKNFSCIFLIGNMGEYLNAQDKHRGSSGHWSSLVYYQDNELEQHFFAMNTKSNEDLLKDPRNLAIVGMVEQFFYRH